MQRLFDQHPLRRGAHPSRDDGMCAMEMVAWLAGERHSDEPDCACPVIASFVRAVNDGLPSDEARDAMLRPLVPRFVNTRGNAADQRRRGLLVADAVVRHFVPHLLEKRGLRSEAEALRMLPAVTTVSGARTALHALDFWAKDQHAARWVLQRAIEGAPAARYVAGAVQTIKQAGDAKAWELAVQLAAALASRADVDRPAVDPVELDLDPADVNGRSW
ncbi:MAG: hypothetical protein VYE77_01435 [Planctomycetota bacterium]|nr:hypothetical protein [Planctomycetota bacterium]